MFKPFLTLSFFFSLISVWSIFVKSGSLSQTSGAISNSKTMSAYDSYY